MVKQRDGPFDRWLRGNGSGSFVRIRIAGSKLYFLNGGAPIYVRKRL